MWRRMVIVVAVAAVTVGLAAPSHAATILLTNGDFETGDLTEWDIYNPGLNNAVNVITDPVQHGSYGLEVTGTGTTCATAHIPTISGLTAGQGGDFSGWFRQDSGAPLTGDGYARYGYYWGTATAWQGPYNVVSYLPASPTDTWIQSSAHLTVPSGYTTLTIEAVGSYFGNFSTVYFDNVSVTIRRTSATMAKCWPR